MQSTGAVAAVVVPSKPRKHAKHATHSYHDAYPQIAFALFFLAVQFFFMRFEPIPEISDIHSRIRGFIVDKSPACIDSEYDCVALSEVHSWEVMAIWANQSLIKPVWGDYQGSPGVILQYLSLGEELVIWTRRSEVLQGHDACPSDVKNFVTNCAIRRDKISKSSFVFEDEMLRYDRKVNEALPEDSLYENPNRRGFFYDTIPVADFSMANATDAWTKMYESSYFGVATEEVVLMFLVVSPKTRIISLVQVHFITDSRAGDIEPSFSVWSFLITNKEDKIRTHCFDALYLLLLVYLLVIEVTEMLGFEVTHGRPTCVSRDGLDAKAAVAHYFRNINIWDCVDWLIMGLGFYSWALRLQAEVNVDEAIVELNNPGSNALAYAKLIRAQTAETYFVMIGATCFLISGFRLFKYFADHPRLGEISKTMSRASIAIGHFLVVFIVMLLVFGCAGHFLFAYAYPTDWGSMSASMIATIKMITGEISYKSLVAAYGSTTVDFQTAAEIPVMLFFFGFFLLVIMLMLNIFLGIILAAYDHVHTDVMSLPPDAYNVFVDAKAGAMWLVRALLCQKQAAFAARNADPGPGHGPEETNVQELQQQISLMANKVKNLERSVAKVQARRGAGGVREIPLDFGTLGPGGLLCCDGGVANDDTVPGWSDQEENIPIEFETKTCEADAEALATIHALPADSA